MKISIITVVYNNEKTILDAINSVLSQSNIELEYIIIDGNSTDGTLNKINTKKDYINILISENDFGIYDAMNKGISLATGDIIGILNSDDFYVNNNVLKWVVEEFVSNPSIDIVYGNLLYVSSKDVTKIVRKWNTKQYYATFFEDGLVPPHPSFFVKSTIYKKIGLFNLDFKYAADYEFMLRVFKSKYNFKAKFIDKNLVYMRLGGTTNKNILNILRGNMEILKAWNINGLKLPFKFYPKRIFRKLHQYI